MKTKQKLTMLFILSLLLTGWHINAQINIAPSATVTTTLNNFPLHGGKANNIANLTDGDKSTSGSKDYAFHPVGANGKTLTFDFGQTTYSNGSIKIFRRNGCCNNRLDGSTIAFMLDDVVAETHTVGAAQHNATDGKFSSFTPANTTELVFNKVVITFSGDTQNLREIEIQGALVSVFNDPFTNNNDNNIAPSASVITQCNVFSTGSKADNIASLTDGVKSSAGPLDWAFGPRDAHIPGNRLTFNFIGRRYINGSVKIFRRNSSCCNHRLTGSTLRFMLDNFVVSTHTIPGPQYNPTDGRFNVITPDSDLVFNRVVISFVNSGNHIQNLREIEIFGTEVSTTNNSLTNLDNIAPTASVTTNINSFLLNDKARNIQYLTDGTKSPFRTFTDIDTRSDKEIILDFGERSYNNGSIKIYSGHSNPDNLVGAQIIFSLDSLGKEVFTIEANSDISYTLAPITEFNKVVIEFGDISNVDLLEIEIFGSEVTTSFDADGTTSNTFTINKNKLNNYSALYLNPNETSANTRFRLANGNNAFYLESLGSSPNDYKPILKAGNDGNIEIEGDLTVKGDIILENDIAELNDPDPVVFVDENDDVLSPDDIEETFHVAGISVFSKHDTDTQAIEIDDKYISNGYNSWFEGGIVADKLAFVATADWADYVFEFDYNLKTLAQTEAFIKENGHLPTFKSAAHYEENGYEMQDMVKNMVVTIEEQTLHNIAQQKKIDKQAALIEALLKRIEVLENGNVNKN